MSKYLKFVHDDILERELVINKKHNSMLGSIEYYKPWKQYVFTPEEDTIFNDTCLQDIVQKLQECNKK